ncbi:MAG TPA: YbdK family carboxylate-amine ligase [Thermoleophilaceae bacterium]|jgi:carboxylate-amine ligase
MPTAEPDLTPELLRARFDAAGPLTVGLEEEVLLLDPETHDLTPRAAEVLDRLGDPARFKPELPAAQLEIVTAPHERLDGALAELSSSRATLVQAAAGIARPAASGLHPFTDPFGELAALDAYEHTRSEYGRVARLQLVSALQVHVAVGGAERSLAVYNALRSYLPEILALSANAPYIGGLDSGMATARPKINELLPRQGVPPAISSWDEFAESLRWGAAAGNVHTPRTWWWELRPHAAYGTLEVRVPDAQSTIEDAGALAGFVVALVARLAERHDADEPLPVAPTWRIEENRWAAARHGSDGTLADLETGERRPTRDRLLALIDEVGAEAARPLAERGGYVRQRDVAGERGLPGLAAWLAEAFVPGMRGP